MNVGTIKWPISRLFRWELKLAVRETRLKQSCIHFILNGIAAVRALL
jgi:hypothetical protein